MASPPKLHGAALLADDYVLGTDARESERLGIQHLAWRPIVTDCWRRAGIGRGLRVLDVGAGPGYAALDLARLVGPSGSVTAVERSSHFVAAGRSAAAVRGVKNLDYRELDLMTEPLPDGPFDAVWCRWVCSFVDSPARLVDEMRRVMRPGGVVVFFEYANYASWRFAPPLPLVEEYIDRVMIAWTLQGGQPDVAMPLVGLLADRGFTIREANPRIYCCSPGDALWAWISTFVESNTARMAELGECSEEWARRVLSEFRSAEQDPATRMLTPLVLEIIVDDPRDAIDGDERVIDSGKSPARPI